jgi:hypothetical protein
MGWFLAVFAVAVMCAGLWLMVTATRRQPDYVPMRPRPDSNPGSVQVLPEPDALLELTRPSDRNAGPVLECGVILPAIEGKVSSDVQ